MRFHVYINNVSGTECEPHEIEAKDWSELLRKIGRLIRDECLFGESFDVAVIRQDDEEPAKVVE